MPRNRVLSFMSQFGSKSPIFGPVEDNGFKKSTDSSTPPRDMEKEARLSKRPPSTIENATSRTSFQQKLDYQSPSPPKSPTIATSRSRADSRATGRPNSMIQTWQPPQVDVMNDTPPELQPIFSYLNSHSNKLYQEGYFLKLHDLDSRGRPSQDRVWTECFAQLVGTVLSLWDAAALDAAGEDGEVMPTFINLSDASLKMIESLPMNGSQGDTLQNVLSISTAANNRYLLHFNSLNSLTQWTAGIRLAIFEHSTLQEAYTGSIIAGKGKYLNNIKQIMDRSKFVYEDWARVRFGAGTPWRRCWCVISPPDEKEYAKAQKLIKKGTYGRTQLPKGDVKFYDSRRVTKKTRPIATITDAYAAYAVYPQSKPLIDQSTLVKVEGAIKIHSSAESLTEGFVFVMPEVHPAVSGFEMMLRWLFPVFDTFGLYGRPTRLIADVLDQRGLMFAMPRDRRYGYLDILDVSGIIHTSGSQNWTERQWRREMKKLTSQRMTTIMEGGVAEFRPSNRRHPANRASLPPGGGLRFDDIESIRSTPGSRSASPAANSIAERTPPRRMDSAPGDVPHSKLHKRSVSDVRPYRPSRLSQESTRLDSDDSGPIPPRHGGALASALARSRAPGAFEQSAAGGISHQRPDSYAENGQSAPMPAYLPPPEPVLSPPAFTHSANSRPAVKPGQAPELRRAHSNVDEETLSEMRDAVRPENRADPSQSMVSPPPPGYSSEGIPFRSIASEDERSPSPVDRSGEVKNLSVRDLRRLSTIPGSPYVGEGSEYFATQQQMPLMDEMMTRGRQEEAPNRAGNDERPPMVPRHSSGQIARKPVPRTDPQGSQGQGNGSAPASQVRSDQSPSPDSPPGSFVGALIDKDALERILNNEWERTDTLSTAVSSVPDYASTVSRSSHKEQVPVEKTRAGRLKTVGDPDMPATDPRSGGAGRYDIYNKEMAAQSADLPTIDFGPTYTYKPTSRPGTSGRITPGADPNSRSGSANRLRNASQERLSTYLSPSPGTTPGEESRRSYFGGRTTPTGIAPAQQANHRLSMAWTPGTGSPVVGPPNPTELTPEEWVQHRAALASRPLPVPRKPSPLNAHQRADSSGSAQTLKQAMATTPPAFSRSNSGDWTQLRTRTPPSRPHSRGASVMLNPAQVISPNLTAKEQMHVARATGSPFVNMSPGPSRATADTSPGLIGALAARERDKAAIKEGMRSEAVQHAIAARQQEQFMLQQQQLHRQQLQQQQLQQQQLQQQQIHRHSRQMSQMTPEYYQQMMEQQAAATAAAQSAYAASVMQSRPSPHLRSQSRQSIASNMYLQQSPSTPQLGYAPQAGGFGGAFVQQQGAPSSMYGMAPASQSQYTLAQQPQQQHQQQQPQPQPQQQQQQQYYGGNVYQQQQGGQWSERR